MYFIIGDSCNGSIENIGVKKKKEKKIREWDDIVECNYVLRKRSWNIEDTEMRVKATTF